MTEFAKPTQDGYTIYTKSNCPFCTKVKVLLSMESPTIIDCDNYLSKDRDGFLEFIKGQASKEYKTFPMVFHNGEFIGGYTDTKSYVDKVVAFTECDEF